ITRVDAAIGTLIEFLRSSGLMDRTLIIFTSDHGEELGDHWTLQKGGYFDGAYHIPLVVRDPRPSADPGRGRVVSAFTENVDIMPTLLAAIGAAIPAQCDGADLSPFLRGRPVPERWREEAHWEFDFRDVADGDAEAAFGLTMDRCNLNVVRGGRYKYVHFAGLSPLFFDLKEDPGEFENRAEDPAHLPLVLAHAQKLLSWRMEHDEHGLDHMALTDTGLVSR
ncbi:MAG: sulfatase-like hydrolase/transferase, partial [Caulobacteraceae bacterium]